MSANNLREMMVDRPLRFGAASTTGWDYFDYAPGQPNLFLLSRFKQLLVKEHGLKVGFDRYRRTISKQGSALLNSCRLESHYAFSKAHAAEFHEWIAPGEPFTLMPPKVIGEGNHRQLTGRTRSFYVSCLENALIRGRSSIVETKGVALADFQGDELARIDDEVEFDAAVFHRDRDKLWMIAHPQPGLEFDEALSLLGCRTDFFGDWLRDSMTRYVAATMVGSLPSVPILIDAHMPKTHRQALELFCPLGAAIVEIEAFQPVFVRRLWWPPGMSYVPFHPILNERFKWDYLAWPPRHSVLVENEMMRRADLIDAPVSGPPRVFLARKDFRHRRMVNRAEIEAIVTSFGFAIVYTEELEFNEQARMLHSARYVVAPEGSSLFLRMFMGHGAKLCILNHQQTEGLVLYNIGADEKQIEVTILTGPEDGERSGRSQDMNYTIDAKVFQRFLDGWCYPSVQA